MHVIDVAEHHDRKLHSPLVVEMWREAKPHIPKARRFIFDKEASAFAGAFIRDFPEALLNGLEFAIPPFETTYIEYHLDALLDAIGRRKTSDDIYGGADERIGHLIHRNMVATFIEDSTGAASIYPVAIELHTENYTRGMFNPKDIHDDIYKKLYYTLGSTVRDLATMRPQLRSSHAFFNWKNHINITTSEMFRSLLEEDKLRDGGNGTVRNLVALLLMLNRQRERVTLTQVPPKGVIYKGKRKVFMAHSLVTLTTEDYGAITRSFAPASHHESPRRHEVRGFFRHYHKVKGCEHNFLEDNRPHHWTCQHCGTIRVWVRDHLRGDASKGFVTKEYVVTDPAGDYDGQ